MHIWHWFLCASPHRLIHISHPNLQPFISIFHSTPLLPFVIASRNPPRSCYKIHIHILNSTSISFPPQLTPSLPLSNSFVIHRLAFLLLSAFYSIVFLYFMLNPNHLPLITSFHYSPLWLLLFLLFTFWNRIFVFVIYGFPSLFSCSWNCLLNLIPSVNRHDDSYAGLFFWIIMINIMFLFLYSEFLHLFVGFPLWIFIFSVRPCAFLGFLFLFLNI